jgi:hypothetical protein
MMERNSRVGIRRWLRGIGKPRTIIYLLAD